MHECFFSLDGVLDLFKLLDDGRSSSSSTNNATARI